MYGACSVYIFMMTAIEVGEYNHYLLLITSAIGEENKQK